jgi:hypothetical protein
VSRSIIGARALPNRVRLRGRLRAGVRVRVRVRVRISSYLRLQSLCDCPPSSRSYQKIKTILILSSQTQS